MKKTLTALTLLCAIGVVATISSCNKVCGTGYEGSDCKTAMNTKFAGSYSVHDTAVISGAQAIFTYTMNVTASSSDPSAITISNFGGFNPGSSTAGTVNGTILTVPNTTIGGVAITNASGSISSNALSFVYTATDTTGTSTDHAVGLK